MSVEQEPSDGCGCIIGLGLIVMVLFIVFMFHLALAQPGHRYRGCRAAGRPIDVCVLDP